MSATTVDLAACRVVATVVALLLVVLFHDVVRDIWRGRI